MLSFFRRLFKSWVVLALLAVVAIAVVVTGVGTPSGLGLKGGGAGGPETIATMKGGKVDSAEIEQRTRQAFAAEQRQNPGLTLPIFIGAGAVDQVVRQVVTGTALERWAEKQGITASDRLVDAQIAAIPAFAGPSGKFDPNVYRSLLAQQHITDAQIRDDFWADTVRRQLITPVGGGARAPDAMVNAYAKLVLEKRTGSIAFVPLEAMPAPAAPNDAAIAAAYAAGRARYALPEQRVLRYAAIGPEQVAGQTAASDAEIAAAYQANAAQYAAKEVRSFSRLVFPTEAAARAFAARLKGGTPFAAAAQGAGFSAADAALGVQTQDQLAQAATPAIAAAAFALPEGGVTDPLKAPLGWFVVRADSVKREAARPLAAVRAEIAAGIVKQKTDKALADLVDKIDDRLGAGATFDDVAKQFGLTPVTTPALVAQGVAPADPAYRPTPEAQALLKPAFDPNASADDDATVETIGPGRFALFKLARIVPTAPIPLAQVRDRVIADVALRSRSARAKAVADAIAAKVKAGAPLAAAIAAAGVRLPPPQSTSVTQGQLAQARGTPPAALLALFRMIPGGVKLLPEPGGRGWFVVRLDAITPSPTAIEPPLLQSARGELDRTLSQDYGEEFANAIAKVMDVRENRDAIARAKAAIAGVPAGQ